MSITSRQPTGRARAWLTVALLAVASACTDSVNRTLAPAVPTTINEARSHADSAAVGYFALRPTRAGLVPGVASSSVAGAAAGTIVSVSPGWFQGSAQPQPITVVVSGPVNSVTVVGNGALLCTGTYGTIVAYDANGVQLGSQPLSLIDPTDCGWDDVTFGARGTLTVSTGTIASFKILPMNPVDFPVNGFPGGKASATYSVTLGVSQVDAPPKALWGAGCWPAQLKCTFYGSGSTDDVGIVSYRWDWGNGRSETHSTPTATNTWAAAGNYNISLTVTDTKGQTDTYAYVLQIGVPSGTPPFTAFNTNCGGPTNNTTCVFDSSPSVGSSAIVRSWSFGDGTTAGDVVAPSHTYAAPGMYAVLLKVTDAGGLSDYLALAVKVGLPIGGPWGMGVSSDCTSVPGTCFMIGNASGNNPPFTFAWDWGDGATSGNSANVSHAYTKSGTYAVLLTGTDALGGVNGIAIQVTVTVPVVVPPTDAPPVAAFTWSCTGQAVPHQCAFDASNSTDDKGIVSYKWDWGNGRSETKVGKTSKNTWASAGTFPVTLTVTDTKGQTSSLQQSVVVP